jgi:hypothetical protein
VLPLTPLKRPTTRAYSLPAKLGFLLVSGVGGGNRKSGMKSEPVERNCQEKVQKRNKIGRTRGDMLQDDEENLKENYSTVRFEC